MPTFITIGYGDRAGYEKTDPSIRDRAHRHDEKLAREGALIGRAGAPVQVRNPSGKDVRHEPGAYLRSDLPVAGFMMIEAEDIDAAIALVADTPCAIADGVVEIWPFEGPLG